MKRIQTALSSCPHKKNIKILKRNKKNKNILQKIMLLVTQQENVTCYEWNKKVSKRDRISQMQVI